jgi:low temperature requirement protein LtrA
MTQPQDTADRHASWLELFFDLVVVVAVSQLAHLLHGDERHGPGGLAITTFFALYLAIWLVWTTFMLYSNVVADKVRRRVMFLGMAGIATMAAAVPHGTGERSAVFAAAYLLTSALGATSFTRSGHILLSWSAATRNVGLLPWLVAFWIHDSWWKLGLWLLGLAMTLWFGMLGGHRDGDELIARYNERAARRVQRVRDGQRHEKRAAATPTLVVAQVDGAHLGERLGLFVIIVLGEAMLQLIGAVAEIEDWSPDAGRGWLLLLTVAAGFGLLIALWWLNVRHGFAQETRFPPAFVLPAHFVAIAAVVAIAAGLGTAAAESAGHLPAATAWLMCAGTSAYLLVITALTRHTRGWPLTTATIALPLGAAALAPLVPAAAIVTTLLAVTATQTWNLAAQGGSRVAGG